MAMGWRQQISEGSCSSDRSVCRSPGLSRSSHLRGGWDSVAGHDPPIDGDGTLPKLAIDLRDARGLTRFPAIMQKVDGRDPKLLPNRLSPW